MTAILHIALLFCMNIHFIPKLVLVPPGEKAKTCQCDFDPIFGHWVQPSQEVECLLPFYQSFVVTLSFYEMTVSTSTLKKIE